MSYDLQLDRETHDLVIDAGTGDIQIIDGARRVAQQIKVTLLLFLGEWFLDTSFGVPYLDSIMVMNPRFGTLHAVFRAKIANVPGVTRVRSLSFDFNRATRGLAVTFEAETTDGLTGVHNIVLSLQRRAT